MNLLFSLLLGACSSGGTPEPVATTPTGRPPSDGPTVVQPGAPGEASREVGVDSVEDLGMPGWTRADAAFMSGMIHHHAQALQMTALIPERSESRAVHQMGLRMEISQRDEIRLMQRWLERRGLEAPEVVLEPGPRQGRMGQGEGMMAGMQMMPGMLSTQQMRALREARGEAFDRLFLEYMIQHHGGALVMVKELFESPGAAQDSDVFRFASDVDADQQAEIARMTDLLEQYR